jgi:hypothetical protein
MKKLSSCIGVIVFCLVLSCSHKVYTPSFFDIETADHRVVAILPAEMIFTGKESGTLSSDDIKRIEESESKSFQQSLYNSILRHANSRTYFTRVNLQDLVVTKRVLEENSISVREAWKMDDIELMKLLKVDAVVRLRIQKQRYMSDLASYGISMGKQIIHSTALGSRFPIPISSRTNDIYASCDLVSNNRTLWNDNYKQASDWNSSSDMIIENITDNFGRHFPYKQRR